MAKMGKTTPTVSKPAELEHTPANCHAREVMARVGDKWSVYVMHVLGESKAVRFNELRGQVDGISQRMLTVTLRGLERDGMVSRKVYPEVPPRVEYSLTPLGATLRQLVRGLVAWSGAHVAEVDAARAAYDARNGRGKSTPILERSVRVHGRLARAAAQGPGAVAAR